MRGLEHVLPDVVDGPEAVAGQGCDGLLDSRQLRLNRDSDKLLQQGVEGGVQLGNAGFLQGGFQQPKTFES